MAKLGNQANTDKIGRYISETMGPGVYVERGLPVTSQGGAIPRQIRVASRPSRLSDKIKMEPPDMLGSPVSPGSHQGSPAPPGVTSFAGGHMVKPPVSPQHYTGGNMYTAAAAPQSLAGTIPPPAISPGGQGLYYPSSGQHGMVPGQHRVSPPLHQQYYHLPHNVPQSYSPDSALGHGGSGYSGGGGVMGPPPQHGQPAISQLLDLDSQKCIDQNPIELDINNINSAELRSLLPSEHDFNVSMVDAHLSENLSSNLNIIDPPPPPSSSSISQQHNKLSKTCGASSGPSPYTLNIPQARHEVSTGGSDSLNNLKTELELLNELSSAH
ncbi:hypothetical protein Pcinc_026082 [Petrolisthes cinctipes]|uniref:Uncharacterized protein n=1 Tax=Petrolisthes cinctipes TaxID=88211 RepID=A0AAE1F806_PETCI|nr:hypothetical protein Pcinc_026082 [Petrolisthes cinctipes]